VIFTSGGTEANTLALWGAVQGAAEAGKRITRLFISAIEHSSVRANAAAMAERIPGLRLDVIPVSADGVIDLEALRVMLREGKGRVLVAVMAANNETGVLQPLAEISKLLAEHEGYLLVDAIQAAGKVSLDLQAAHYVALSAHKLGGPQGAGALIVRDGAPLAATVLGGGHERGRRAGTENVSGIAGFGAAAEAASLASPALRDSFEMQLKALAPDVVIFGAKAPRLATTSNFAIPGLSAETAMMALDLDGVMVSSGSACSSGKVRASHVLSAMGVDEALALSALRVSFGWNSTQADVDAGIAALSKLVARVARKAA
jgi:cysteine desulfurase